MDNQQFSLEEWHRKQAVANFNRTWDLIDKQDRTFEEDMEMIHTAHASRFHWGKIGQAVNFARGEWQIARVYALLGKGESSLFHANYSLKLCLDHHINDFDLAFGYEAVARAYMLLNNLGKSNEYIQLALEAAEAIQKEEDKKYFLSELKTIQAVVVGGN